MQWPSVQTPTPHVRLEQQGCPMPPHAAHTPSQTRPGPAHESPGQQASPAAPHWEQTPFAQPSPGLVQMS